MAGTVGDRLYQAVLVLFTDAATAGKLTGMLMDAVPVAQLESLLGNDDNTALENMLREAHAALVQATPAAVAEPSVLESSGGGGGGGGGRSAAEAKQSALDRKLYQLDQQLKTERSRYEDTIESLTLAKKDLQERQHRAAKLQLVERFGELKILRLLGAGQRACVFGCVAKDQRRHHHRRVSSETNHDNDGDDGDFLAVKVGTTHSWVGLSLIHI